MAEAPLADPASLQHPPELVLGLAAAKTPDAPTPTTFVGAVWRGKEKVADLRVDATNGQANFTLSNLPPGDYVVTLQALAADGTLLNQHRPQNEVFGPFTIAETAPLSTALDVPLASPTPLASTDPHATTPQNRSTPLSGLGSGAAGGFFSPREELDFYMSAQSGAIVTHRNPPTIMPYSYPAEPLALAGQALGATPPLGDADGLTLSAAAIQATVKGVYTAFALDPANAKATYLGPLRISASDSDPLNPGQPTLCWHLLDKTRQFYFDAHDRLVASSDFAKEQGALWRIDPEPVPQDTFFSGLYPQGTSDRRFLYLDADRMIYNLNFGADPDAGLIGASFPDPALGTVIVQRVSP